MSAEKRKNNIRLTVIGVLLLAFAGVAGFVHKVTTPRVLSERELSNNGAMVFDKPRIFSDVQLLDHRGEPFTSEQLTGQWSVLLFGFTYCPDICPTGLSNLNQMYKELSPDEQADLQVVMVSVDPERDTPEVLNTYVPYFNKDFVGITGDPHRIRRLAAELNIAYEKTPLAGGDYTVDHSGSIVLINPYGHYHGFFRYPQDPTQMRLTWRSIREAF